MRLKTFLGEGVVRCVEYKTIKRRRVVYKIVSKKELNPTVTMMDIEAPFVARKAEPGQFIILRVDENGERIPLTIAGYDREKGTVKIIFQIVGATTALLNNKNEGEYIQDFVGPLGTATHLEGLKKVAVVGGGVGCAIALPIAQKLHDMGCEVHSIIGARNKDLLILEDEFNAASDKFIVMTDDGSYGRKGVVTVPLQELIESGEKYDEVIAIGPLIMMKFVVATTRPFNIKTVVSMNPIMIDGTGMCGGCRLTVGGKTKFACVDGPDFDGFEVDFDEAMARGTMYKPFEREAHEHVCNLLKKEVK
jgi:ferredoxin--NADP+ reductase